MTTRRGFLGVMLAAAAAPAIVKASSLMPIYVPKIILWGDGLHDDTPALQALFDGRPFINRGNGIAMRRPDGTVLLSSGTFALGGKIDLTGSGADGAAILNSRFTMLNESGGLLVRARQNNELEGVRITHNVFQSVIVEPCREPILRWARTG